MELSSVATGLQAPGCGIVAGPLDDVLPRDWQLPVTRFPPAG